TSMAMAGDELNDVVIVLNPHGWGMARFEQKGDAQDKISFVRHRIMDSFWTRNAGDVVFSEPHGTTFADIDGDGVPDFVVGKRYWSHRDDSARRECSRAKERAAPHWRTDGEGLNSPREGGRRGPRVPHQSALECWGTREPGKSGDVTVTCLG
ncbi:MAG TPA: VCBS repeat-containing protein, partial [Acidobacteriaceae bacterium]|nr:VCBS repeat-containing protein [Acidobacteriaceae bacterium]